MHRHSAGALLVWLVGTPLQAEALRQTDDGFLWGETRLAPAEDFRAPLPRGDAGWRFDCNSNFLVSQGNVTLAPASGLHVGGWIALASPPTDTGSLVHVDGGSAGVLSLSVNPWLQPEFRLGGIRVASFDALPLGEWVHLAGDHVNGVTRLWMNGTQIGAVAGPVPDALSGSLTIARNPAAGLQQDVHPLGGLNGALMDVVLAVGGFDPSTIADPTVDPGLDAVSPWFADDPNRPALHPVGPLGWTNEPHALIHREGQWHLYHQANPNGAFLRRIVWGHLVSNDLGDWQPRLPALVPSTGFDNSGIWVGNWIAGIEPPSVLYTGVNGQWAGLGVAEAGVQGTFVKRSMVSATTPRAYEDMRDPFVLRTDEG